jgi:hypothetical protein
MIQCSFPWKLPVHTKSGSQPRGFSKDQKSCEAGLFEVRYLYERIQAKVQFQANPTDRYDYWFRFHDDGPEFSSVGAFQVDRAA